MTIPDRSVYSFPAEMRKIQLMISSRLAINAHQHEQQLLPDVGFRWRRLGLTRRRAATRSSRIRRSMACLSSAARSAAVVAGRNGQSNIIHQDKRTPSQAAGNTSAKMRKARSTFLHCYSHTDGKRDSLRSSRQLLHAASRSLDRVDHHRNDLEQVAADAVEALRRRSSESDLLTAATMH